MSDDDEERYKTIAGMASKIVQEWTERGLDPAMIDPEAERVKLHVQDLIEFLCTYAEAHNLKPIDVLKTLAICNRHFIDYIAGMAIPPLREGLRKTLVMQVRITIETHIPDPTPTDPKKKAN